MSCKKASALYLGDTPNCQDNMDVHVQLMVCEACGQERTALYPVQFLSGSVERVCRGCIEAWARVFGGAAADVLQQLPKEAK